MLFFFQNFISNIRMCAITRLNAPCQLRSSSSRCVNVNSALWNLQSRIMAASTATVCSCASLILTPTLAFQQFTPIFVDLLISVQKYFSAGYISFVYPDNVTDKREFIILHHHWRLSSPVPPATAAADIIFPWSSLLSPVFRVQWHSNVQTSLWVFY